MLPNLMATVDVILAVEGAVLGLIMMAAFLRDKQRDLMILALALLSIAIAGRGLADAVIVTSERSIIATLGAPLLWLAVVGRGMVVLFLLFVNALIASDMLANWLRSVVRRLTRDR